MRRLEDDQVDVVARRGPPQRRPGRQQGPVGVGDLVGEHVEAIVVERPLARARTRSRRGCPRSPGPPRCTTRVSTALAPGRPARRPGTSAGRDRAWSNRASEKATRTRPTADDRRPGGPPGAAAAGERADPVQARRAMTGSSTSDATVRLRGRAGRRLRTQRRAAPSGRTGRRATQRRWPARAAG